MKKKQVKRLAKQLYKNYIHDAIAKGANPSIAIPWRRVHPVWKKFFISQATPYSVVLETPKRITPADTGVLKASIDWRPLSREKTA